MQFHWTDPVTDMESCPMARPDKFVQTNGGTTTFDPLVTETRNLLRMIPIARQPLWTTNLIIPWVIKCINRIAVPDEISAFSLKLSEYQQSHVFKQYKNKNKPIWGIAADFLRTFGERGDPRLMLSLGFCSGPIPSLIAYYMTIVEYSITNLRILCLHSFWYAE